MSWSKTLPARNGKEITVYTDPKGIHIYVPDVRVGLTVNQSADLAAELLEANRHAENEGAR